MKFFKHFCDAHRGQSLKKVRRNLGVSGIGMFWIVVEICAEKMEKLPEEEFNEAHCHFEFERHYFCHELGIKPKRLENVLRTFLECSLFVPECSDNIIKIYFPKLLDSLDRNTYRARRATVAKPPKIKSIDKEEDKDTYIQPSMNVKKDLAIKVKSWEELKESIPIIAMERFSRLYSDAEWLNSAIENCYHFHSADPVKVPQNSGQWMKKLIAWLDNNWSKKQSSGPKKKTTLEILMEDEQNGIDAISGRTN